MIGTQSYFLLLWGVLIGWIASVLILALAALARRNPVYAVLALALLSAGLGFAHWITEAIQG